MASYCDYDGDEFAIYRPRANEIHKSGDTLDVWWYIGRPRGLESRFAFSLYLQSQSEPNLNVTLDYEFFGAYPNSSPEVVKFNDCGDQRIEKKFTIPRDLQTTETLFEVVIVYETGIGLQYWPSSPKHTGPSITILPATPTSTSAEQPAQTTVNDPTNEPAVSQDVTSKPESSKLSTGTKAGIAVGVVALVAIFGLAVWGFFRLRQRLQKLEKVRTGPGEEQEDDSINPRPPEGTADQGQMSEVANKTTQYHDFMSDAGVSELDPGEERRPLSELGGTAYWGDRL